MRTLIRFLLAFLVITGAVAIAASWFGVHFDTIDYWQNHGFWFLVFLTLFPRLTLLFGDVASGGVLWWLSWVFAPRI
jgi:hypothetical protein